VLIEFSSKQVRKGQMGKQKLTGTLSSRTRCNCLESEENLWGDPRKLRGKSASSTSREIRSEG